MDLSQPSMAALAPLLATAWSLGAGATDAQTAACALQARQLAELRWQLELTAKLNYLFNIVAQKFSAGQVCVFQAWLTYPESLTASLSTPGASPPELSLYAEPSLVCVGDPSFWEFRAKSCQTPLQYKNSMPGRVWRTGAVQIVQNMKIIPPMLHPRNNLRDEDLDKLADVLYIPVYDTSRPAKGPVTVLEVFLSAKAPQDMLVADFISFVSDTLAAVQLSVSNPVPQPIRRSALSGRRARPPSGDVSKDDIGQDEDACTPSGAQGDVSSAPPPAPAGPAATTSPSSAAASTAVRPASRTASPPASTSLHPAEPSAAGNSDHPTPRSNRSSTHTVSSQEARPSTTEAEDCGAKDQTGGEPSPKVRKVSSLQRSRSVFAVHQLDHSKIVEHKAPDVTPATEQRRQSPQPPQNV